MLPANLRVIPTRGVTVRAKRSVLQLLCLMNQRHTTPRHLRRQGFTMIELLVSLVIVSLLATLGVVGFQRTQQRTRDAQRKHDLQDIKIAFEDYYNDNGCYPAEGSLDACGDGSLAPYLKQIPCDTQTNQPYGYVPLANACQGYRLYTELEVTDDEDIVNAGCDGTTGCGYPLVPEYNYGVAVGTSVNYTP
jgi:prepilin-type N-terminal cleavage/methylation domain-containing protein